MGTAWTLETSNAPELGTGSVAEGTMTDAANGAPGVLLVTSTLPADPRQDMSEDELKIARRRGIRALPLDRPGSHPRRTARPGHAMGRIGALYLNVPSAAATALVDPTRWSELALRDVPLEDGVRITLGFRRLDVPGCHRARELRRGRAPPTRGTLGTGRPR